GPEDWHDLKLNKTNQCGGNRQSPINIKTSEVEEEDSYRRLKIAFDNTRGLVTGTLENNGHSPELIIADSNGASLTGGPLGNNKFELIQFHVHFGCVNERGSEHKLNGKQLSGELHMVFGHDEEPRVVGNKIFGKLANLMHHIIKPEDTYPVTKEHGIYLKDLIPKKCSIKKGNGAKRLTLKCYFTYRGSLTTPPCTQTIRWIVLKDYILASTSQLEKFRKLEAKYYGPHMCDNFRPVQKLNDRDVYSVSKKNNDK
ncbi:unnamed protein product, partial [Porites evermanni]